MGVQTKTRGAAVRLSYAAALVVWLGVSPQACRPVVVPQQQFVGRFRFCGPDVCSYIEIRPDHSYRAWGTGDQRNLGIMQGKWSRDSGTCLRLEPPPYPDLPANYRLEDFVFWWCHEDGQWLKVDQDESTEPATRRHTEFLPVSDREREHDPR